MLLVLASLGLGRNQINAPGLRMCLIGSLYGEKRDHWLNGYALSFNALITYTQHVPPASPNFIEHIHACSEIHK